VAFQGIPGSFSSMAARAIFGNHISSIHTQQFREIFDCVADDRADFGVVPIENAVAGSVHENYDLLGQYSCAIVGEVQIPVQLHLMGVPASENGNSRKTLKVYSHPKALEQCSLFFDHHPEIEAVVWSDTAGAAKHVSTTGDPAIAAIASQEAATLYGLQIIERSLQNHPDNSTRFVAISKQPQPELHPTKCSLIVSLTHKPGSLYAILGEIAQLGLNLTKLESRPILGAPFSYSFHMDIECPEGASESLKAVVERISKTAEKAKILGFYRQYR